MTGAEIVAESLLLHGVTTVFGYPGGNVLPLYEALRRREGKIRHVLSCHEQGAVHAADGYARASGGLGVVLATSGPGATNLVTGIAAAYMDSTPLLAITGNVPLRDLGRDCFQEIDIAGVTMPITKHNYIVRSVDELEGVLREAIHIARSGRPGPVLVDIPVDVAQAEGAFQRLAPLPPSLPPLRCSHRVDTFMDYICAHRRPVLLLGGGVVSSGAGQEALALCQLLDLPVCTTLMGLGTIPEDHPCFLGMLGIHGTEAARQAVAESDLLIAVGTRFNERVAPDRERFAPKAHLLHLDVDEAEIGKNLPADRFMVGDAKKALGVLLLQPATRRYTAWREQAVGKPRTGDGGFPRKILQALWRYRLPGDTLVTDVGRHQMWAARYYPVDRPRAFLTSGGLGAMGFGMGAAVGAALARPESRILLITGDGSLHMDMAELATAVTEGLPLKIFCMNDESLGLVRQLQEQAYGSGYAVWPRRKTSLPELARAFGARGETIRADGDWEKTLRSVLDDPGPCLIDCRIEEEEEGECRKTAL